MVAVESLFTEPKLPPLFHHHDTTIQSTNTDAFGTAFLPLPCDFTSTRVYECQVWWSSKLCPTAAGRFDARPVGLNSLLSVPWAGPDPPTAARQAHSDSVVRHSIQCNLEPWLKTYIPWPES